MFRLISASELTLKLQGSANRISLLLLFIILYLSQIGSSRKNVAESRKESSNKSLSESLSNALAKLNHLKQRSALRSCLSICWRATPRNLLCSGSMGSGFSYRRSFQVGRLGERFKRRLLLLRQQVYRRSMEMVTRYE